MCRIKSSSLLLSVFIVVLAIGTHADEPQFRVNSFIPEKFADMQLFVNGNFNLSGNNNNSDIIYSTEGSHPDRQSKDDNDRQSVSLSTQLKTRYETIPKYFHSGSSLRFKFNNSDRSSSRSYIKDFDYSNFEIIDQDEHNYEINFAQNIDAGLYTAKDFFMSLIGRANINYSEGTAESYELDSNSYFNDTYKFINIGHSLYNYDNSVEDYYIDAELLYGYGRVYNGVYAATAMYMIDELKKAGYIDKEPSYPQMIEMTDIIYQYRLKYYDDRRIHRIEALTAVGEYLQQQGLADDFGTGGQLIIQDVWDYFPRSLRYFGFKFRAGIGYNYVHRKRDGNSKNHYRSLDLRQEIADPEIIDTIYYNDNEYSTDYFNELDTKWPFISVRAEYYRPLNRKWQLNLNYQLQYYLDSKSSDKDQSVQDYGQHQRHYNIENYNYDDHYGMNLHTEVRYFVDSRTSLSFTGSYDHDHYTREVHSVSGDYNPLDTSYTEPETDNWNIRIESSLTYRIAIPTTLNINAGYRFGSRLIPYYTDSYYDEDFSNYSFRVSIRHYML